MHESDGDMRPGPGKKFNTCLIAAFIRFAAKLAKCWPDDKKWAATSPETGRSRLQAPELVEFANSLIGGVRRNRAELDALLEQTADHWSLERMAATDRNVLRLGAYEILYADTPGRVAINEAVELAKRYGTGQSSRFVNGILDRLQTVERGAAPAPPSEDPPPPSED